MQEYVSAILGLEIGNYYHLADNMHYYEDFKDMIKAIANISEVNDEVMNFHKSFTSLEEFDVLLKQMDLINHIEGVDEAIPMTFPFVCVHDFLREDEPYNELTVEEGLKNAADVLDNQIKLPKVVN